MSDQQAVCVNRTPSLYQDVLRNVALCPKAPAFSDEKASYTWSEFNTKVDSVAYKLASAGIGEGSVVAVYMHNSTHFPICLYAIWRLGAIFAPINSRLSAVEAQRMAADVSAKLIIVDELGDAAGSGEPAVPARTSSSLVGGDGERGSRHVRVVAGTQPAWLFFTSGTSGTPKAAVLTHSQLHAVISNGLVDLMMGRLSREDTAMAVAPLSHGALTHLLRQVRLGGATYIYSRRHFDELLVLRDIQKRQIRSVFLVPTMVRRLCAAAGDTDYRGTLSALLSGGEPLTKELIDSVERVFGRVLVNYYGLAEVTGAISQARSELVHGHSIAGHVPAGVVRAGTAIEIRDPDGQPVEAGQRGDIWVTGENMFAGYLIGGRLDTSAIVDGWYNTKDMGYLGVDGLLYIDGRSTDMFISGGSNVYPQEIERVLRQQDGVDECAVVGIPDAKWGEIGVAFIASATTHGVDENACAERVRQDLGSYKVPKRFVVLPELPKTPMNKTDRKQLRRIAMGEQGTP